MCHVYCKVIIENTQLNRFIKNLYFIESKIKVKPTCNFSIKIKTKRVRQLVNSIKFYFIKIILLYIFYS